MAELRLDEIAARVKGRIVRGEPSRLFRTFNIDSRLTRQGELFFAIRAKRDGHEFVPGARQKGAAGAVVSRAVPEAGGDFAIVRVEDTLAALEDLARSVLAERAVKVIGITGSVGKTTTKEFAAALLSRRFRVLKSEGNFNNKLGLALSLLRLEPGHQLAVLEMGTSSFGEIRELTRIAPPDIPVITNVNPVHLEFLGDLEGVARAKKEILEGAREKAIAVLSADDARVRALGEDWLGRRLTFGFSADADIRAVSVRTLGEEGTDVELLYMGNKAAVRLTFLYQESVADLLAAVAVCAALDMPLEKIVSGIPDLRPLPGRGLMTRLPGGILLVDDSYNSNPRALAAALEGLACVPAHRRIAVLGDMLELGEKEAEYHLAAGGQVVEFGWDVLVAVGPLGRRLAEGALAAGLDSSRMHLFATPEEAAAAVRSLAREGDLILVKGSRGTHLERISERLFAELKET
jgi:UDP-N-acetylmuramoyl-tripeptide--D-alanyl-D-alanine ligase